MEEQDTNTIANLYLRELHKNGMQSTFVVHESIRVKASSVYGDADAHDFVKKMDREFKQRQQLEKETLEHAFRPNAQKEGPMCVRYDVDSVPEKFVLKNRHKYFYGIRNSATLWTYDIRLALPLTQIESDAIACWLDDFGTPVHKLPALAQTTRVE